MAQIADKNINLQYWLKGHHEVDLKNLPIIAQAIILKPAKFAIASIQYGYNKIKDSLTNSNNKPQLLLKRNVTNRTEYLSKYHWYNHNLQNTSRNNRTTALSR